MRRAVPALIIAASMSLSLSSPGFALTEIPKIVKPITSFSLTPVIGGYLFAGSQALNQTALFGLKLSYDDIGTTLPDTFGIEGTVNYFTTTSKTGSEKATGYLFRADAIYSITPRKKLVPFFAIGIGEMLLSRGSQFEGDPLINYGLGLKYYLEEYLALRVDARQLLVYKDASTRSNFEVSAGLTYLFGKEHKKVAPKPVAPIEKPKVKSIYDEEETIVAPGAPVREPTTMEKLGVLGAEGYLLPPPPFETPVAEQPKTGLAFKNPVPVTPEQRAEIEAVRAAARKNPAPATPPGTEPEPEKTTAPAAAPVTETAPAPAPAPVSVPGPTLVPLPSPATPPAMPGVREIAPPGEALRAPSASKPVARSAVRFDFGAADVGKRLEQRVRTAAQLAIASKNSTVTIEEQADLADKNAHPASPQIRAQGLRDALVKFGVDPAKIHIKAHEPGKPAADGTKKAGQRKTSKAVSVITVNLGQ